MTTHILAITYQPKIEGVRNGTIRQIVQFFVYIDGPEQVESGLARCRQLKQWGTNPFVVWNMDKSRTNEVRNLQRWANRKWLFWKIDFAEYKGGTTGAIYPQREFPRSFTTQVTESE